MKRCSRLAVCTFLFALGCGTDGADESPKAGTELAQTTAPAAPTSFLTSTVKGEYDGALFTGTLSVTRFVADAGSVYAVGSFSGVEGVPQKAIDALQAQPIKLPVSVEPDGGFPTDPATPLSCEVLGLFLSPLHFDLAGADVDLDKVVLDVTTTPGGGSVLASLLCGVPDLLEGGGLLTKLPGDLDTLLSILDGLTGVAPEDQPTKLPTVTAVPLHDGVHSVAR